MVVFLTPFSVVDVVTDVKYSLPYFFVSEELTIPYLVPTPTIRALLTVFYADFSFIHCCPQNRLTQSLLYRINACDQDDKYESLKAEFASEVRRLPSPSDIIDDVREASTSFPMDT